MHNAKKMKRQILLFFIISLSTISVTSQSISESWESYIATYDENKPGSTTVRMDLLDRTPIPNFNYVLVTGLTYESEREDGFPQGDTFELLHKVGDELIEILKTNGDNLLVGSFMYNFQRLEYFYLKSDNDIEKQLEEFYKSKYPNNKYYINLKEDKNWSYYRDFLYPNDDTLNYISDQKVVDQLIKSGDNLEKERRIDHWIYFSNKKNMELFKTEVTKSNFKIEFSGINDQTDLPFEIRIWRVDKVDIESIHPITNNLRKLAIKYNGDYDGWETSVESE